MIHTQNDKTVKVLAPIAVASATATDTIVDAGDAKYATFEFHIGVATGNMSVCKIQSSATSGGSYTDITGAAFADGAGGAAVGIGAASDGLIYAIHIDLTDHNIGRFLQLVMTEDATGSSLVSVTCRLSRKSVSANTLAARGYTAEAFA